MPELGSCFAISRFAALEFVCGLLASAKTQSVNWAGELCTFDCVHGHSPVERGDFVCVYVCVRVCTYVHAFMCECMRV
jgi:hypothetical protein